MIGIRLKKMRAERNLTQRELAKLSKVSYVQIAKYEKDKSNPTPKVIGKLASALNVPVDYFFGFET
jgi:transcriptional regulator with XRE-family HTH domain